MSNVAIYCFHDDPLPFNTNSNTLLETNCRTQCSQLYFNVAFNPTFFSLSSPPPPRWILTISLLYLQAEVIRALSYSMGKFIAAIRKQLSGFLSRQSNDTCYFSLSFSWLVEIISWSAISMPSCAGVMSHSTAPYIHSMYLILSGHSIDYFDIYWSVYLH